MAEEPPGGNWLSGLIHELKDVRFSLPVAIIGAIFTALTWMPDWFGIRAAIQWWRPYAMLAMISGAVLFATHAVAGIREHRRAARRRTEKEEARRKTAAEAEHAARESAAAMQAANIRFLEGMTPVERATCRSFVAANQRSQTLPSVSHVVELARRGVLIKISEEPMAWDHSEHYVMADWAWDHLQEHPEILDGAPRSGPIR